jgi:hypothetical protein
MRTATLGACRFRRSGIRCIGNHRAAPLDRDPTNERTHEFHSWQGNPCRHRAYMPRRNHPAGIHELREPLPAAKKGREFLRDSNIHFGVSPSPCRRIGKSQGNILKGTFDWDSSFIQNEWCSGRRATPGEENRR